MGNRGFLNTQNYERFTNLVGRLELDSVAFIGRLGLSELIGEADAIEGNATINATKLDLVRVIRQYSGTFAGTPLYEIVERRPAMEQRMSDLTRELATQIDEHRRRIQEREQREHNNNRSQSLLLNPKIQSLVQFVILAFAIIATTTAVVQCMHQASTTAPATPTPTPEIPTIKTAQQVPLTNSDHLIF